MPRAPFVTSRPATLLARRCCALAALALPPTATAQRARTPAPPDQLTMTLLQRLYPDHGGRPEILSGAVPTEVAARLAIPFGSSIDGTVVWPGDVMVFGSVSGSTDSLVTRFQREMVAKGWTAGPAGVRVIQRIDSLWPPNERPVTAGRETLRPSGSSSYWGSTTYSGIPFAIVCRGLERAKLMFSDPEIRPLHFSIETDSVSAPQECRIF